MSYAEDALQQIEQNKFTDLKKTIDLSLKNDEPEVIASLAEELTAYGFSDYAKDIYRQLIADFPQEDIFKVYLAEILVNEDQIYAGLQLLYEINPASTAYVQSLLVQADYYQSEGLVEAAEQKLLEATRLAPDEEVVWFALAELFYAIGNYNNALEYYQKLIRENIRELSGVDINRRLANTWAHIGEFERASDLIAQSNTDELDINAQYEGGLIFLQADRIKEAIEAFNSVIEVQPDYVNVYPNLALAYQQEHDNDNVLATAQIGLSYNKFDEVLYDLGSKAAANLQDYQTAIKLLEDGLAVNPDNSSLRLSLSNLYLQQGEHEKNIGLFEEIADEEIEDQAHWNLAVSYDSLDELEKARPQYLLAYRSFNDNTDFLLQVIHLFQELGDTTSLKLALNSYLKLQPEDFEMQELLQSLDE
ncbi:TPR repeat-containing protein [Amylolactobacillus amylotrophicus DSM 20534]|uniref:Peptide-binding protein n=3 Tax=Amylolactobacillus TaxID=2767876 RepID=A0A1L6XDW4_9LACO|nr:MULTISPECIES: tetratricopeptide repeat protein [Amylolactobacillus]APT19172.1 peptide-binding protein [Amylolactobacillus amylophilus DSM 20533 = JCM 1125]KRK38556.1 TPR repeat-containing protein [Amylolactobacillus amylotrophicus DSM 20534]KRM42801.1 TPR repeat-containing protein [Amylolactobacillus amylophilus DSM 20533 = JCM 1125]GED79664.1 peptide-binding protein [Amylolactobacillus amylophilus]